MHVNARKTPGSPDSAGRFAFRPIVLSDGRHLLKVGDTIRIRQKGQFVSDGENLYWDQPEDQFTTIENEAKLQRLCDNSPKVIA